MTVSVVIPTRDRRDLVLRALASVRAQTRQAQQVLVVDDGSRDDTVQAVQRAFPEVELLRQEPAGVSSARNHGVRRARGEWVAFLDSDDEWKPEKLAQQLDVLEAHPECDLCHTDEVWIRRGNQVQQRRIHRKRGGWIFEHCLPRCAISPSAALIRRQLLERVGGFDESFPACEDYDLWLRLCALTPVAFVSAPLVVKHGGHDDQLSRRYPAMDRFRLRALAGVLADRRLALREEQRAATWATLHEKLAIYSSGALRRGKQKEVEELVEELREILERGGVSSATLDRAPDGVSQAGTRGAARALLKTSHPTASSGSLRQTGGGEAAATSRLRAAE